MAARAPSATCPDSILQLLLAALHHLTGLLMVNQPDHNLPCMTRDEQMRADQKNAELRSPTLKGFPERSATWSDHEAPEEELSDLSSSDSEDEMQDEAPVANCAQHQLFDGLQFYLAVSQVRERTVRSVLSLGMAKTMNTLRERRQRESIAVIEQQYPDFTCLPTRSTAVRQLPGHPPMDLLSALRLPSATAMAQSKSPMKHNESSWSTADAEGRVRRAAALASPHNSSRVA